MEALEYCLGIPESNDRRAIVSALSVCGHHFVGEGRDSAHFLRVMRKVQPQLAIMEISLPGRIWEAAEVVEQESMAALLLLDGGKRESPQTLNFRTFPYQVFTLPVDETVLSVVVETLWIEFMRKKELRAELRELKEKLQSRTIIERAKGVIMRDLSLTEEQAYRFLQKKSMDLRLPLKKVAEKVFEKN